MNHKDIGDRKKNDDIVAAQSQEKTKKRKKKDPTEKTNQFGREYDTK